MRVSALLWAVCWLVGCPKPAELSFEADIAPVIAARCVACHNPSKMEAGLDLSTDPYTALTQTHSSQGNYPLVTPGNHLESYAWHKLNGTQSLAGGSGTSMPLGSAWQADFIDVVGEWIDEGAAP